MTNSETIQLAVKSLLEVVQTGAKNIDLAVMEGFGKVRVSFLTLDLFVLLSISLGSDKLLIPGTLLLQNLTADELTAVVAEIEKEKEAEQERKKSRLAAAAASRDAMMTGDGETVIAPTAEEEAGGAGGV